MLTLGYVQMATFFMGECIEKHLYYSSTSRISSNHTRVSIKHYMYMIQKPEIYMAEQVKKNKNKAK